MPATKQTPLTVEYFETRLGEAVDSLAIAVAKGFKEIQESMTAIDGSIRASMKSSFSEVNTRLTTLETRVSAIEETMATKDDIARLESKFDALEKVVFKDHGPRIRRIERKIQIA